MTPWKIGAVLPGFGKLKPIPAPMHIRDTLSWVYPYPCHALIIIVPTCWVTVTIIKYPATCMPYPAGHALCSRFPDFVTQLFPSRHPFIIFHHPTHHPTCHPTCHLPITHCPLYDSCTSGHVLHPPWLCDACDNGLCPALCKFVEQLLPHL